VTRTAVNRREARLVIHATAILFTLVEAVVAVEHLFWKAAFGQRALACRCLWPVVPGMVGWAFGDEFPERRR
jgi:hypothetical protein